MEAMLFIALTFIAHISCDGIPSNEIEFQLYDHQPASLGAELSKSSGSSNAPTIAAVSTAATTITSLIPIVSEITNAIYAVSNTVAFLQADSNGKHATNSMAKAIVGEVSSQIVNDRLFILDTLISTIKYAVRQKNVSEGTITSVELRLFEVINTFANVKSPFHKYPALAAPILLTLPKLVEFFMEQVATPAIKADSKVPCNLANTIQMYFKPIALNRMLQIQVATDFYAFPRHSKYVYAKKFARGNIDPVDYLKYPKTSVACQKRSGSYETEINQFGGIVYESIGPTGQGNIGRVNAYANDEEFDYIFMKDDLAVNKSIFYRDEGNAYYCVMDYFQLVRQRLETAFAEAYNRVNRLCKADPARTMTPTGRGLLTITLGAVLAELLPNGDVCDMDWGSVSINGKFCDPYVEITVGDTVYATQVTIDAAGWVTLDETFYFPNLDKNARITIQIKDSDNTSDDVLFDITYKIEDLLDAAAHNFANSKLLLVATWREEIDDSNFNLVAFSKN